MKIEKALEVVSTTLVSTTVHINLPLQLSTRFLLSMTNDRSNREIALQTDLYSLAEDILLNPAFTSFHESSF